MMGNKCWDPNFQRYWRKFFAGWHTSGFSYKSSRRDVLSSACGAWHRLFSQVDGLQVCGLRHLSPSLLLRLSSGASLDVAVNRAYVTHLAAAASEPFREWRRLSSQALWIFALLFHSSFFPHRWIHKAAMDCSIDCYWESEFFVTA